MTLNDYIASCKKFAADTAEWGGLDPYKQYVAIPGGDWAESCDNHENGIYLDWAFGLPADRLNPGGAEEMYRDAFRTEWEQGLDEGWDADQFRVVSAKYESCIINREGCVFCDQWDAIVNMMDQDLMFSIQDDCESCQEVFSAYETAHEEEFGEEWELSKSNPTW